MLNRRSGRRRHAAPALALALLAAIALIGCDARADLVDYFGTPRPTGQPTATVAPGGPTTSAPPGATAGPTSSVSPSTPTGTPAATPTTTVAPEPTPTATPAWSPMPTRPPTLPDFAALRERAEVTDVAALSSRPAELTGATVYFEGRVNDVEERGGRVRARVKIGEQFVYLVYRTDRYWGDHPLVQADRIRVVGEFLGLSDPSVGERLPEIEPIDMIHRFA